MPDIAIDTDAVQSARITMLTVRDTLNGLYSQYEHTAGQMEGSLWDAASEVLDSLNPLHLLEAFDIWDRWGFGGVAYSCSSTRGALEDARGVTDQVVERLCEAHPGPVAPLLHDRANDLRAAISAALDSLWSITSLLNPQEIRRLIENPGSILDHSASVRGSLRRACDAAQAFVDFLTRLHANEQALIDEITHSLAVTSPQGLQGIAIGIQGSLISPQQGPTLTLVGETPATQAPQSRRRNPPVPGLPKYAATPEAAILAWAEYYEKQPNYYSLSNRLGQWDDAQGYGFDCSGFVYKVYHDSGNGDLLKGDTLSHPHDASILENEYSSGTAVAITNLNGPVPKGIVPGSLVFFKDKSDTAGTPIHVAIVESVGSTIGSIRVIGATYPGHGVDSYSIADFAGSSVEPETAIRFVTFD